MEEKKLNLDAPFLSVRRIQTKPEKLPESENTGKKTTSRRTKKVKGSSQETEHETLVRLLQDDQSFDHVMEPSSVPFTWEQTPGKPKNHHMATTLIQELDLIKALDMGSSTASFSVNCSTNGVSDDEFEKHGDRSSDVSRDDIILDLIMSRFLPAAKAIAMKQKKESSLDQDEKKKQSITQHKVSIVINQDIKHHDDDDDYDDNHVDGIDQKVNSNDTKKALFGFMPKICSKNSLDILNPVLSRVRKCQDLTKSGKNVTPKLQDSVYKTKSSPSSIPRILALNKVMSKSQEIYPIPRFSTESSKISLSKSGEIVRISRNPTRLQRTMSEQIQSQGTRFLVEEVKRRSNINKNRSRTLPQIVSQPPLPKSPSESWLCRTLPRNLAASVVSGQAVGFKKMERKSISLSTKWETIVKTSYKHHDHVCYSEELIVCSSLSPTQTLKLE